MLNNKTKPDIDYQSDDNSSDSEVENSEESTSGESCGDSGDESDDEKQEKKTKSSNLEKISDDIFNKKEENKKKSELLPLMFRVSFPFCFWYFYNIDDKDIEKFNKTVSSVIKQLVQIDEVEIYLIRGNKEKDRIRVICPNIFVNIQVAKDLRSLILRDLGYKANSNLIPALIYEVPSTPTILMSRVWDMGLGKWESYQSYICLNHSKTKTEQLEKLLSDWLSYGGKDLTPFTKEYEEYISVKEGDSSVLNDEEQVSILIGDNEVSEEIKKEVGGNLDKCIEWFKKYHHDSGLRAIKRLGDDVFFLDFTKSKNKCRLCNLVHLSNRQYLTYSSKSEKAFYHCYDNDAYGKKHVISFKKKKKASSVVSPL